MCWIEVNQSKRIIGAIFFILCFFSIAGNGLMLFERVFKLQLHLKASHSLLDLFSQEVETGERGRKVLSNLSAG